MIGLWLNEYKQHSEPRLEEMCIARDARVGEYKRSSRQTMNVKLAETDEEVARCFPVMVQLRPHLSREEFMGQVNRQRQSGYQLAFLEADGAVRAVAGFRILEMLSRGRFMYVDDLVTDATARSLGYGGQLFDWLLAYAVDQGCQQIDLDSGVQRTGAHRFYFQKRMHIASFHFALSLVEIGD